MLEIIGEASNQISPEFRENHSAIPWRLMIGMRNRIVHGYFDINLDIVWRAVIEEVPLLLTAIKPILEEEGLV